MDILDGLNSADWDGVAQTWNFHRYNALLRHWAKFGAPIHRMAAIRWGAIQPPKTKPKGGYDDFEADMRALAPGGSG